MYRILHLPTNTVLFTQFLTQGEPSKKELSFYTPEDAHKAILQVLRLVGVYNSSINHRIGDTLGSPAPITRTFTYALYKRYERAARILEQGFGTALGVERRNSITFYGNVIPLLQIMCIDADYSAHISMSKNEFLVIQETCQ